MEHGWERTLPIIKIDDNTIKKLFRSIENPEDIKKFDRLGYSFRSDLSSDAEYVFERKK